MKTGNYVSKSIKLEKSLNKYLNKLEKPLTRRYGKSKTNDIIAKAKNHYPEIIPRIPYVDTPMYDTLLVLITG